MFKILRQSQIDLIIGSSRLEEEQEQYKQTKKLKKLNVLATIIAIIGLGYGTISTFYLIKDHKKQDTNSTIIEKIDKIIDNQQVLKDTDSIMIEKTDVIINNQQTLIKTIDIQKKS